jgi:very-short-patch-repair endonuclease
MREREEKMNLEDMSYLLATQGYTMMHFWDVMEFQNMSTVEDAIVWIYNNKFGKC